MNKFSLDDAVKNVKSLVENNRCVHCDQLNVLIVRYPCGHTTCNNCVATAEDCLLCLTPPEVSTHFIDGPSSLRVEHITQLLTAFQELFNVDVYKRYRLSEKLKVEKELFPECIQASSKYTNKRKSFVNKVSRKQSRRLTSFPGEEISFKKPYIMENIENNVEQWMNKNETFQKNLNKLPRKPFTNLNVNIQKNKNANISVVQTGNEKSLSRKRTNLKLLKDTSNESKVPCKKFKGQSSLKEKQNVDKRKSENNESGIFIDDEIVVIDDSQGEPLDKDQLAIQAVLEADNTDQSADCGIEISMNESETKTKHNSNQNNSNDISNTYKVPFLKRSSIAEVCKLCIEACEVKSTQSSKNVTVTIDSESYITTINVVDCSESVQSAKRHLAVQTEPVDQTKVAKEKVETTNFNLPNISLREVKLKPQSESDKETKQIDKDINAFANKSKELIIEESDAESDLSNGEGNSFNVVTECDEPNKIPCLVLGELKRNDYQNRGRHALREHSPNSTDSSDKENYDPNRMKKLHAKKKFCFKK